MSQNTPLFEHISPPAPTQPLDRRDFIKGALAAGFATAVLPISAQTIHTDSINLTVGEVKIPTADGSIPAYFAMPSQGKAKTLALYSSCMKFLVFMNTSKTSADVWPKRVTMRLRPNYSSAKVMCRP